MNRVEKLPLLKLIHKKVTSPEETSQLAAEFAAQLQPGDVVALYGNLGAGKTHFVKALCQALKVENVATSPTFTIVNEYQSEDGQIFYHFDFYRIEHQAELVNLGLEDYFYNDYICLIEWPEKIGEDLPLCRYEVYLQFVENQPSAREICIEKIG